MFESQYGGECCKGKVLGGGFGGSELASRSEWTVERLRSLPIPGNKIPAGLLSPIGLGLMKHWPALNTTAGREDLWWDFASRDPLDGNGDLSMRRERAFVMFVLAAGLACAQRSEGPQPVVVDPGGPGKAPSDAIVLFNGRDNSGWTTLDGAPSKCTVADGVMSCRTGAGDTRSTEQFRDAQIHLEFNLPYEPQMRGQGRANSGILLLNRYEIQILDSYRNATYANGSCGALYGQSAPLVNACRPPGEWQSFDIIFHAPRCGSDGGVQTDGSLTLLHNGVLIQDHVPVRPRKCDVDEGPLVLQDHGRVVGRKIATAAGVVEGAPDTTVKFRNIWMRRLHQ